MVIGDLGFPQYSQNTVVPKMFQQFRIIFFSNFLKLLYSFQQDCFFLSLIDFSLLVEAKLIAQPLFFIKFLFFHQVIDLQKL